MMRRCTTLSARFGGFKRRALRQHVRLKRWSDGWPVTAKNLTVFTAGVLTTLMMQQGWSSLTSSEHGFTMALSEHDAVSFVVYLFVAGGGLLTVTSSLVGGQMLAVERLRIVKRTPDRTKNLRYLGRTMRALNLVGLAFVCVEAVVARVIIALHL